MDEQKTLAALYLELDTVQREQLKDYRDSVVIYRAIIEQQDKTITMLLDTIEKMAAVGKA